MVFQHLMIRLHLHSVAWDGKEAGFKVKEVFPHLKRAYIPGEIFVKLCKERKIYVRITKSIWSKLVLQFRNKEVNKEELAKMKNSKQRIFIEKESRLGAHSVFYIKRLGKHGKISEHEFAHLWELGEIEVYISKHPWKIILKAFRNNNVHKLERLLKGKEKTEKNNTIDFKKAVKELKKKGFKGKELKKAKKKLQEAA